jgi:hypothetical protein
MMVILKRMSLLILLSLVFYSTSSAQQLIAKSTKNFKVHYGVTGGVGVSTFLENSNAQALPFVPEGYTSYSTMYAPRPEAQLGLFMELESKKRLAIQTSITYAMRAIPKPVFSGGAAANNSYNSIYLNGLSFSGILFIKATEKFRFGLGFEVTKFFMTNQLQDGIYSDYAQQYDLFRGVKTVVAYKLNPRTEMNIYAMVGNQLMEKMQVDNISVGATLTYRLYGREYKIEKEVYKIDYVK